MSVIGVDFDGTLALDGGFIAGNILAPADPRMVAIVRTLHKEGHILCAWTCRADYVAEAWLKSVGLRDLFSYINRSPYPTESGKASFDFYIGDDAIMWDGTGEVLELIRSKAPLRSFNYERDKDFSSHNPVPYLAGVGEAYVDGFEQHWRDAWRRHQQGGRSVALLTICSHAKPYSKSFIHTSIRSALYRDSALDLVDYAHISNAGIIPADAEMDYPFNAYDWDGSLCSPEVTAYHTAAIERRLADWLSAHADKYHKIVFYLREGGNTCGAVERVLAAMPSPNLKAPRILVAADAGRNHYPSFVRIPDPDDCLTSGGNLYRLVQAIRKGN